MSKAQTFIWTFVGAGAVGKTSCILQLAKLGYLTEAISFTTRPLRAGEVNGVNYHFITVKEFHELVDSKGLAEYIEFSGNFYGLLKRTIDQDLGKAHVGAAVEPRGCQQLALMYPGRLISIYIEPPSQEVLVQRMKDRQPTITEEEIEKRMIADEATYDFKDKAHFTLPPGDMNSWVRTFDQWFKQYQ